MPMVRRAPLLLASLGLAALALAACSSNKPPGPSSTPDIAAPDGPAETAPPKDTANSAPAPASPAAEPLPPGSPPSPEELGKRFRGEAPLAHVAAYAVDEACLLPQNLPPKVSQGNVSLTDLQEGDLHYSSADTNGTSAAQLADLRAFIASFPKGKHRFVITTYEWGLDEKDKHRGFRALCLPPKPLFAGPSQMGRIRHKDGTYDEDKYRIGLADTALQKLQALPRQATRLAFLWDDDLLVLLPVDKLKEIKLPAITLAPMPPP
ncbi:MAG: hypothetical protein U0359_22725 [Byssovorax sp.]